MEVVRSSVLCTWLAPLWHWLRERYEYSLLARILRGIALGWRRAYHSSAVVGVLSREGVLTRAWPESVLCRVLTFLLSIPTILLQKLYSVGQDVFEHSVFARIAFAVVEQTPLAVAWIMVLFLALLPQMPRPSSRALTPLTSWPLPCTRCARAWRAISPPMVRAHPSLLRATLPAP